jgi:hypothetical protein
LHRDGGGDVFSDMAGEQVTEPEYTIVIDKDGERLFHFSWWPGIATTEQVLGMARCHLEYDRRHSMPSKSPEQAKLMRAAAHDPKFAKKTGVPTKVAKEFVKADKKLQRPPSGKKGK